MRKNPVTRLRYLLSLTPAALAAFMIFTAPGAALAHGDEADGGEAGTFGHPGKASAVDRTVKIDAEDTKFDITSLRVQVGETVRFVVTDTGVLDHGFTIGDSDLQADHRREMAAMIRKYGMNGMIKRHHDANAVMLKPGQTKQIIWTFTKAGTLQFGCDVPGHYQAGMHGKIVVTPRS